MLKQLTTQNSILTYSYESLIMIHETKSGRNVKKVNFLCFDFGTANVANMQTVFSPGDSMLPIVLYIIENMTTKHASHGPQ